MRDRGWTWVKLDSLATNRNQWCPLAETLCTRRNDYIFFLNHWQSFMFIMPLCQMVLLFIYSNLKWLVWQLLWNTQLLGEASRVRWQHLARWAKDLEETWEEQVLGSVVFKMRFESKIMTFFCFITWYVEDAMVSALDSGLKGLALRPGWANVLCS